MRWRAVWSCCGVDEDWVFKESNAGEAAPVKNAMPITMNRFSGI